MLRNHSSANAVRSDIERDLYFLIVRFLSNGPCNEAAKMLVKEMKENELFHRSLDWMGRDQASEFEDMILKFRGIAPNHLMRLCLQAGQHLDAEMPPPIKTTPSLLGAGRYSLLRTKETVEKNTWSFRTFTAVLGQKPVVTPHNFQPEHNWALSICGRELGGSRFVSLLRPVNTLYSRMKLQRRILGHLSSVYCVLFDRTGSRIFTGSDDCLVKCWSSRDGRLLSTFRGHQTEICDIDVSHENTILASGSCDKEIRIWDIRSGKPITILQGHNAMLTSIEFSPLIQGNTRYLVSTARDGNVCFWSWNVESLEFETQPFKFQERNCPGVAMLCSSWSSGGRFLAVGGSDNLVHIYHIPLDANNTVIGPISIAEQNEHTDTVDSLWFSHDGLRFITGSKDGTAQVWTFENSTWNSKVLNVSQSEDKKQDSSPYNTAKTSSRSQTNLNANKVFVIMVAWDCCDQNVMTSLTDFSIKVWNSTSQKLVSVLKGHVGEAYCLEPHPTEKRIFLSAGHDGNVFLWDVSCGHIMKKFYNMLEGQGHGAVFDAKFSHDGSLVVCTDSHGHLLIFGWEDSDEFQKVPEQQFFHTDYRPLIRDQYGYVLDEQTQQAPHLMPPPFSVDVEGNPYPPEMQRLVPGRERCNTLQLIPSLITGENGLPEVLQINDVDENVSPDGEVLVNLPADEEVRGDAAVVLDQMISQMQAGLGTVSEQPVQLASPRSAPVGLLREGDVVGIRQMHSNAPRSQLASPADIMALTRRVITPQFSCIENMRRNNERKSKGRYELAWYRNEKRKQKKSRKQSHDITKQFPSSSKTSTKAKSNHQVILLDDEPEVEESNLFRRNRRRKTFAHRYSTRSNAPRRRDLVSPGERRSSHQRLSSSSNLDTNLEESNSSESVETTPVSSSSEEDFSKKAMILRRSRRNRNAVQRGRIKSENGDSAVEDSDKDFAESTGSTTGSIFSPGIEKRKIVKQRNLFGVSNGRLSSTQSSKPDLDDSEMEELNGDDTSHKSESNEEQASTPEKMHDTSFRRKKICRLKKAKQYKRIPFEVIVGQPPPPIYLPPDWIIRVTPCHSPFVPQIGDEVVYLRQGHECYIQKVRQENVWKVEEDGICYNNCPELSATEHCRVINIEFHTGPPTLCEVFLRPTMRKVSKAEISSDFSVKYHDMPNVVDFLVLKQKFEKSIARSWKPNDRFRSIIDDTWWYGVIMEHAVFDSHYPSSSFQCFSVLWDSDVSEEIDYLSPWDLEPIPETILQGGNLVATRSRSNTNDPSSVSQTHVDSMELYNVIGYQSKPGEWGSASENGSICSSEETTGNREDKIMISESNRIATGLEQLVNKHMYPEFSTPVDVSIFPTYPLYVAYPTDLSTILQRIQNKFYRRSAAIVWEISCMKNNACVFNEPGAKIVGKAKSLCHLLTTFIEKRDCQNILELKKKLRKRLIMSSEDDVSCSSTEIRNRRTRMNGRLNHRLDSSSDAEQSENGDEQKNETLWIEECKKLLSEVMVMEDSRPFRSQHDSEEDENFKTMDLLSVQEKLASRYYQNPNDFHADIGLIFVNCKRHNTSRDVHSKSTRLSALMNSRIENIIKKWKKNKRLKKYDKRNLRRSSRHRKSLRSNLNDSVFWKTTEEDNFDPDWNNQKQESNEHNKEWHGIPVNARVTRHMNLRQMDSLRRNENNAPGVSKNQNRGNWRKDSAIYEYDSFPLNDDNNDHKMKHAPSMQMQESESELSSDSKEEITPEKGRNRGGKLRNKIPKQRLAEESTDDSDADSIKSMCLKRRTMKRRLSEVNDADLDDSPKIVMKRKKTKISDTEDESEEDLDPNNHEATGSSKEHKIIHEEEYEIHTRRRINSHEHARLPTFSKASKHSTKIRCQLRSIVHRPTRYGDYTDDQETDEEVEKPSSSNNNHMPRLGRRCR